MRDIFYRWSHTTVHCYNLISKYIMMSNIQNVYHNFSPFKFQDDAWPPNLLTCTPVVIGKYIIKIYICTHTHTYMLLLWPATPNLQYINSQWTNEELVTFLRGHSNLYFAFCRHFLKCWQVNYNIRLICPAIVHCVEWMKEGVLSKCHTSGVVPKYARWEFRAPSNVLTLKLVVLFAVGNR